MDSATNNNDDDFTPHPVTSRYLSLQEHLGVLKDAIGAVEDFTMDDTDLPAVKWANAVQDALYNRDGCLGEIQGEAEYTTDDFKEAFGETIATPHDDLTDGERSELKGLFDKSENHDVDDLSGEFSLPVVNGERLPLLVADEDVYEEACEMLETMLDEFDNDAGSTTPAVEDDDETEDIQCAAIAASTDERCQNGAAEGVFCGTHRGHDGPTIHSEGSTTDGESDDEPEADEENDASSTTQDVDAEEIATAVTTAVLEALDN
jgi:hypothetical protein